MNSPTGSDGSRIDMVQIIRDEGWGWVDQSRVVDRGVCLVVTDIVGCDRVVLER